MVTKSRQRARKGEGERLRRDILSAAEDLLVEKGDAAAVSIRAISDRVGCTSPAIYMHWKHKDDLFLELCSTRFGEFSAQVVAGLSQDGPVLDRLADVARAFLRFAEEHPEQYRVLFMRPAPAPLDGAPPTAGAMAFQLLIGVLEAGIQQGEIRDIEPVAAARALLGAVHGVATFIVDPHEDIPAVDPAILVETVIDVSFNGIAARNN